MDEWTKVIEEGKFILLKEVIEECRFLLDCAESFLEQGDKPVAWADLYLLKEEIEENMPSRYAELLNGLKEEE